MLKWTASAQKLPPPETPGLTGLRTPRLSEAKKRKRRATIANKENIPITSTPMVTRMRNSPVVLAPLTDILNITPEPVVERTPERATTQARIGAHRRHSTIGITLPTAPLISYASTLPRFEEEYSPSTMLPSGQQLAMRGLLPDPFLGQPRYFATPELPKPPAQVGGFRKSLPQKRKLEHEFIKLAEEAANTPSAAKKSPHAVAAANTTGLISAKMGDQTLDKLIDAILDSARKEEKKSKKPRKSFNLRRRTLLKNQADAVNDLILSPSYAAGDDPASDLSFLLNEPPTTANGNFHATTPQPALPMPTTPLPATPLPATPLPATPMLVKPMPATPLPATPPPGTPIPAAVLQQMPTPKPDWTLLQAKNDSFTLATPVTALTQRKRQRKPRNLSSNLLESPSKRFKVADARSYFEIGLALPSIYV